MDKFEGRWQFSCSFLPILRIIPAATCLLADSSSFVNPFLIEGVFSSSSGLYSHLGCLACELNVDIDDEAFMADVVVEEEKVVSIP